MAKRRTEIVAASLLGSWTDADTAMQIVGSSLGVFGTGRIDPALVLADETPLRNSLFDVLLSLVEGGALEMRPAGERGYAFRWRDDVEVAGLAPETFTAIDLEAPAPLLAELERARSERDEALGRAEFAEALAAERERLLRANETRDRVEPEVRPVAASQPRAEEPPAVGQPAAEPVVTPPAAKKPAARKPAARKATKKSRRNKSAERKPAEHEPSEVLYLPQPIPDSDPGADAGDAPSDSIDATEALEAAAPRRKWSGYAIDNDRSHLAGVDPVGDVG